MDYFIICYITGKPESLFEQFKKLAVDSIYIFSYLC